MSHINGSRLAGTVIAVACLLGGCSGGSSTAGKSARSQVASLPVDGPKTVAPIDANDQRPLLPVDATAADREALQKVWGNCVTKQGGPGYTNPKKVLMRNDAKAKAVREACLSKEPETFEERQKRTDISAFVDNQRQWYRCAKKAGYKLTALQEDGEFGITEIGPNGDFQSAKMEACRKEAFTE